MKMIFKSTKLEGIFSFKTLVLILSVYVLLPKLMFSIPQNGLDPSWVIAINMAVKQHLVFGKEFIFTCGPLGYLWTRSIIDIPYINILLLHLFLLVCVIFIINYYLKKLQSFFSQIVFFLFVLFMSTHIYSETAFLLFFIFLFFLFHHMEKEKRFSIYIAAFISLLSFFIKMNTGLVLTVLLVIFLLFRVLVKRESIKSVIILLLVYFSLLVISSLLLHVDVFLYVKNSLEIVSQYNDGNNIPAPKNMLLYAALIIAAYLIVILINFKMIILDSRRIITFCYVTVALFIVFKEGFVRADAHMLVLFYSIIPFMSLFYFFENEEKLKSQLRFCIIMMSMISSIAIQIYIPANDPVINAYRNISGIPYRDYILHEYPKNLKKALDNGKRKALLPKRILEKLSGKTVDIIPWDMSYIFFNDLIYNPRPVIQSFNAGCEKLDELNAQKYLSEKAPDFIMYAIGSIDNRHPFWDESRTKLSMLMNYQIDDTIHISSSTGPGANNDFILLCKRQSKRKLVEVSSKNIQYEIGDTLQVPKSDNLIYLYADFEYSLFGKVRRLLYQPNRIAAEIRYEGKETPSYNIAIVPILKAGVLVNKKAQTFSDAYGIFESVGRNNTKVSSIRFLPRSLGFKNKVDIILKEFKIE